MDYISVGSLAVWRHEPISLARGRVILIHGICEHSGRHLNTVRALCSMGFEVVRFDLRGAGHSGGRRQYIDRFTDYCDDTIAVFNWSRANCPKIPTFLMGHSLGGTIALHTAPMIQRLLRGLCLSAPAYIAGSAISPLKIAAGKIINRLLPTYTIASSSDRECISRIPQVIEDYYNDPLSFHFNTVRQGDEVLKAMSRISDVVPAIELPLWIAHGTHDRLIRLEGSFEILQRIGSRHRTMHIILGGYHEPHNDNGMDDYFRALGDWLTNQTTKTEEPACSKDSASGRMTIPQAPAPR